VFDLLDLTVVPLLGAACAEPESVGAVEPGTLGTVSNAISHTAANPTSPIRLHG
jgi:hypothetical protein